MCFDPDSEPPIMPLAGAAIEHREPGAGGRRRQPPGRVRGPPRPPGRGRHPGAPRRARAVLILRGAGAALRRGRRAALAIDYYGRTAGPSRRDASFDFAPHVPRSTWAGLQADVRGRRRPRACHRRRDPAAFGRLLLRRASLAPAGEPAGPGPRRSHRLLRLARGDLPQRHAGTGRDGRLLQLARAGPLRRGGHRHPGR